ncbi:MAG: MFS transporter [Corynebacterium sp.]|nr:MFS transporter [Corynebacterium sp.]
MNLHNMPGFRSLWSAHTIALVGTNTGLIVIPLLALNVTQASVFQMGLLGAAESLAVLLFGIYIGWFVDWLGGRNSMILANVLRAVALSTIPVAYFLGYLTFVQVFIVVFIIGVGTLLYEGAVSSSVVSEFPRSEWSKINSAMEGSSAVTEVAGPGVGGLLVQVIGAPFSVLTDVVMYLFSGVICFFRKDPPKATETTGEAAANEGEEAESRAAVLAGVRFV